MLGNKIDNFNNVTPLIFKNLITDFGFELKEIKTRFINSDKWSTHHQYLNIKLELEIKISQEPYYTDYGFSVFLYNLKNNEHNVLCNVPHEKHDEGIDFLLNAHREIFSNSEIIKMLNGENWEKFDCILIEK